MYAKLRATAPSGMGARSSGIDSSLEQEILRDVSQLYRSKAVESNFKCYHPLATFEDPLTNCVGLPKIKSAFYSLSKIFEKSEPTIFNTSVQDNRIITIDMSTIYTWKWIHAQTTIKSTVYLSIEDGKIIRHEENWNGKPLSTNWAMQTFRNINAKMVHWWIRAQ